MIVNLLIPCRYSAGYYRNKATRCSLRVHYRRYLSFVSRPVFAVSENDCTIRSLNALYTVMYASDGVLTNSPSLCRVAGRSLRCARGKKKKDRILRTLPSVLDCFPGKFTPRAITFSLEPLETHASSRLSFSFDFFFLFFFSSCPGRWS